MCSLLEVVKLWIKFLNVDMVVENELLFIGDDLFFVIMFVFESFVYNFVVFDELYEC